MSLNGYLKLVKKEKLVLMCQEVGVTVTDGSVGGMRKLLYEWAKSDPFNKLPGYDDFLNQIDFVNKVRNCPSPDPDKLEEFFEEKSDDEFHLLEPLRPLSPNIILTTSTTTVTLLPAPITTVTTSAGTPATTTTSVHVGRSVPSAAATTTDMFKGFADAIVNALTSKTTSPLIPFSRELVRRNIRFSGKVGTSIDKFFQEVEDVGVLFSMKESELFVVIKDVLEGPARTLYQTSTDKFQDWAELKYFFKSVYSSRTSDIQLKTDILQRTQIANEKIDHYIATIKAMNNKLSRPMSEAELKEIIHNNLHPEYYRWVKDQYIRNLDDLAYCCRKEEEHDRHMQQYVPPPQRLLRDLESEKPEVKNFGQTSSRFPRDGRHFSSSAKVIVHSPEEKPAGNPELRKRECWNCRQPGHSFFVCRQMPTVFCHNCGKKDTFTLDCDCPQRGARFSKGNSSGTRHQGNA